MIISNNTVMVTGAYLTILWYILIEVKSDRSRSDNIDARSDAIPQSKMVIIQKNTMSMNTCDNATCRRIVRMGLPLEECRAWIYICSGNFWSACSSDVSKYYLIDYKCVIALAVMLLQLGLVSAAVFSGGSSLWKRCVIDMKCDLATCMGFLHLRRFRKYSA